ncbi:MAG: hypothetical protein ACC656_10100, partial [Candidatus Heimdallarchaeota archaeon]
AGRLRSSPWVGIGFFHRLDLTYVSCSPFRIPVARLSAAQATIRHGDVDPKYGKINYGKACPKIR